MKFSALAEQTIDSLDIQQLVFDSVRHSDQDAEKPARHPVVIVGAGPVGLALAIDLAQQKVPVVLLDNDDRLAGGSRAICFAKRTLEIFDRLGCGAPMVAKGVSWSRGRVFLKAEQIYEFDLLPEPGHARPAFINLQQYYVEGMLACRAAKLPLIDLRWRHKVVGIEQASAHTLLTIETAEGQYPLIAEHVVACDGSRSSVRRALGLETQGRTFQDRFLIADVRMKLEQPAERWFWFDPDFHPGQSVLLHMQPDNVWRIDFQLGWDADPEEEKKPEKIIPRVEALLAHSAMKGVPFTLEWASVYTFACQRMARFRHGRVLFAGDAAHGVSPFGARGANSGIQDADNLGWKLAAVLRGEASDALLASYAQEREAAADENILHSTRATDFITPKSAVSRMFRDAVLELARDLAFARQLVNSGRLSTATVLRDSRLNTPDVEGDEFDSTMVPGAAAADAVIEGEDGKSGNSGNDAYVGSLLQKLCSGQFTALLFGNASDEPTLRSKQAVAQAIGQAGQAGRQLTLVRVPMNDAHALAARRYDAQPGTLYLLRPDQHVCARWRRPDASAVRQALARALGKA